MLSDATVRRSRKRLWLIRSLPLAVLTLSILICRRRAINTCGFRLRHLLQCCLCLQTILKRCMHERGEQRVGSEWFRFEFGMELAAQEPRMLVAGKLYDLDELAVGGNAAKNEAAFF